MEPEEPDNSEDLKQGKKALTSYIKYTGIAFQMMGIIVGFAFIGYKLDKWLQHDKQWVTALSCVIGVCLSIYQTIRQLKT